MFESVLVSDSCVEDLRGPTTFFPCLSSGQRPEERKQLTSGTTWHAAGLIGQLRATRNMTELAKYTSDLLHKLEAETG